MATLDDEIPPADVARHVAALCVELASLAREVRMTDVAVLLDGAEHAARRWLHEKAAPEEAA